MVLRDEDELWAVGVAALLVDVRLGLRAPFRYVFYQGHEADSLAVRSAPGLGVARIRVLYKR